jgi:hypothetical protein
MKFPRLQKDDIILWYNVNKSFHKTYLVNTICVVSSVCGEEQYETNRGGTLYRRDLIDYVNLTNQKTNWRILFIFSKEKGIVWQSDWRVT